MNTHRARRSSFLWRRLLVVTAAVIAASGFELGARAADANPSGTDQLRPGEQAFVRQAAELSRLEVALADLGVNQGASSDLRAYAQQLAADMRQLEGSIDALARKKSLVILPATGGAKESYGRLAEKTGADFDRAFVQAMLPANITLERAFEEASSDATRDADLRDLVGNALPVLRDHLNKIEGLRKTIE